ncbi:MAG TPA: hypothetical protein VHY84_13505 [Bryobacteraceae bacterium]|jgi:hypothetical protein|nr:hypothetical protein [Bryobacteraceae bacterium]
MTERDDSLLDAVAGLRTIAPDANWEKRIRARCHSQIARHEEKRAQATVRRLTLIDLAAVAFLVVYLSTFLREAARLGGFL